MPSIDSSVATVLIILVLLSLCIYPVPLIIAIKRNHANKVAIIALNLLLGWTFLGWIASLVWALTTAHQAVYSVPSLPSNGFGAAATLSDAPVKSFTRRDSSDARDSTGPSDASDHSTRSRDIRLIAAGCVAATGIVLISFGAYHVITQLQHKQLAIIGLNEAQSRSIEESIDGTFEKACRQEQIAPLNWPGAKYEAVLYNCTEPKDAPNAGDPMSDDYPAHLVVLRRHNLIGSAEIAVDSNYQNDFSLTAGRLGEKDAVFALSSSGGSGVFPVTDMLIWDDTKNAPRLLNMEAITSKSRAPSGFEYRDNVLWPSWQAASDELGFSADLERPEDPHCCPTGGKLQLTYKTANSGKDWSLVSAQRIAGDGSVEEVGTSAVSGEN